MGRLLRFSLILIQLGWLVGCGGGSGASTNGGSNSNSSSSSSSANSPTTMVAIFNGQYAFLLTGFDATGNPMALVGSLTADGKGNITAGSADLTDNFVLIASTGLVGTYTLDNTLRGVNTFTNTLGSITHPLIFGISMKSNGTSGDVMGLDANPLTIGGTIQQQASSAFSLSSIAGNYVFELDSNAPNETKRQSTIGRFTLAANGTTTAALLDTSVVGVGSTSSTFSAIFNAAGPSASSGRGTLTITQNSTTNYIYYIVAAGKIFVIESDPLGSSSTIRAGVAIGQTIPSSANTSGAVFALAGIDPTSNPSNNDCAVGVLQVSNLSSGSLTWDSNDAGTLHGGTGGANSLSNQTVTYDSTTGRGTVTVSGGFSKGLFDSSVFYLAGSGQGFMVDSTAGANNRALAGSLQPQMQTGSFGAATLSGAMIVRAVGNSVNNTGTVLGVFTPSSNTFTFTFDSRSPGKADALNLVSSGDTISGINGTTGRGTLTITPTNGLGNPTTEILYLVGQNQLVFVDVTSAPANAPAPLFFFDQE
jgi:hypothetical protein